MHRGLRVPMRDGVRPDRRSLRTRNDGTGRHVVGPRPLRPGLAILVAVRACLRVARLSRRRPERSGNLRLRRRVLADGPRNRRRRRHRRMAARPTVVHRIVRHRRDLLSRLHPVGPADRPSAGDEGRGHHRRPARSQRPTLGHRFVRAQRLPRLERHGRPPGGAQDSAPSFGSCGRDGRSRRRRARCRSARPAGRCSARARRGTNPGSSIPSTTTRTGPRCNCIRRWSAHRFRCYCSADGRTCSSSRRWRSTNACVSVGCPSP